jgi:choline dehydrogenase
VVFGQTGAGVDGPDMFIWQAQMPLSTPDNAARYELPDAGWTMFSAIAHPRSRGRIRLTGADALDPVRIELNALSDPDDRTAALACVRLSREIANSAPLGSHVTRGHAGGCVRLGVGVLRASWCEEFLAPGWHGENGS